MRAADKTSFNAQALIQLKNQDWLKKQRVAGKIAARALLALEGLVKDKSSHSLLELNKFAEDFIESQGGILTFKNYKGFPSGVCISVNKQLVHGIPNDYKLVDGDLVSFDLGVTIDGAIADTAVTCIFGEPKSERHLKLIKATEDALMKGIAAIKVGNRIGCIGQAIYAHAKSEGFGVINNYGGHGLDWNVPHAAPFIMNKSNSEEGVRVQPGLTIAIEPMFVLGSTNTKVLPDGWTVVTDDISAHVEHTVFVHSDHVEVITDRTII
jgi:methionyl aminopeptidase